MNFLSAKQVLDRSGVLDDEDTDPGLDFGRLLRAARRQLWIIVLFSCLGLASGAVYLWRAVPRYTATTVVVIDSAKDKSGLAASIADLTYDSGAIDSQLEVLKSEGVARTVVNNLKLVQDVAPVLPAGGIFRWLSAEKTPPSMSPEAKQAQERTLISQLQSNLDVRRVGRSYVINIDYTSPDSVEAARISNAFADAYIGDQLESHFDSMQRSSSWLKQNISELRQKSIDADLAIQKFKSTKGILTSDDKPLGDQQLSELSSALITAKSDLARAETRYAQITELNKANNIPAIVSDTLGSTVINDLRKKYLEAASTESELSNSLGSEHLQAVKLRRTMYELSALIDNEMSRIAAAYKSDAEVARARETSLERSLAALAMKNTDTNESMVRLREMQRESESYKTLNATFVQRLQQLEERQSLPASEARVISPASPPTHPSFPKRLLSMTLWLFSGALIGVALGAVREAQDNVFRVAADVREGLGMEFLGMLPAIRPDTADAAKKVGPFAEPLDFLSSIPFRARDGWQQAKSHFEDNLVAGGFFANALNYLTVILRGARRRWQPATSHYNSRLNAAKPARPASASPYLEELQALAARARSHTLATPELRQINSSDPTLSYVVDRPRTSFSETLRGAKVLIDNHLGKRPAKVVGFISISPNEGKSTVSKNFASLAAALGARVLLIDGDTHRCGLTHRLARHAREGLVEVIRGERALDEVILSEPRSGLSFLPAIVDTGLVHSGQLLTSEGMRRLLEQAKMRFEYVVVDLPPIGPSMDVRAASSLFDCFVLVVKWGHTLRHLVQTSMATEKEIASRCVGVIYNNVELDRIQLYEGPGELSYHYLEHANYY
jgi:polysaccharide biosynthesis transport protein